MFRSRGPKGKSHPRRKLRHDRVVSLMIIVMIIMSTMVMFVLMIVIIMIMPMIMIVIAMVMIMLLSINYYCGHDYGYDGDDHDDVDYYDYSIIMYIIGIISSDHHECEFPAKDQLQP